MSNSESNIIPAAVVSFEGHPEKLRACLHALSSWVSPIIIIHSESDKRVKQIAEEFKVLTSVCPSQATNANWSAGLSKINKQWVLLMRSNEVITGQLRNTIVEKINNTEGTSCQYVLPLPWENGEKMKIGGQDLKFEDLFGLSLQRHRHHKSIF